MTRVSGIYRITNTINGKAYIGRSVDVHSRWAQHRSAAKKGRPFPIYAAIRKYGIEAFVFEVLEVCDPLQLRERELASIEAHGTWASERGYNVGGTNSGFPSKAEIELMPKATADAWKAKMSIVASAGHEALRKLRQDPSYEAAYRSMRSDASRKREAGIRERRKTDEKFDSEMRAIRRAAGACRVDGFQSAVGAAFRERFRSDETYAAPISRNRKLACAASIKVRRANARPSVEKAVAMRLEGALLKDIASAMNKSLAWACAVTKGAASAALS